MKKLLLSLVAVCILGLGVQAQEVFHKGDIVGNLQIGIGVYDGYGIGFPPTSLSVDVGAFDNLIQGKNGSIGIGGYIGFANYRHKEVINNIESKNRSFNMCFGARGTFHYQFVDNLDTYAGIMLGFYSHNQKYVVDSPISGYTITHNSSLSLAHSEFIGVRYYFNDNFAVSSEVGYGLSIISAGISLKF